MNLYDERYDIRLASLSEIDDIMQFIDKHWKKSHIMSLDRNLFIYEFVVNDTVNFIIARDKNTQKIEAIAGFLPCSQTTDTSKLDVWGSFWKVNATHKNISFLGVELIKRLKILLRCRTHLGIGINPVTSLPIHETIFHEKTSRMNHYYILNPKIRNYKIAVIKQIKYNPPIINFPQTNYIQFKNIHEIKKHFNIENLDTIPHKDFWYINKRFFNHPYYSYLVYGLKDTHYQVGAIIVMREVEQFGRKALRIVDYIGKQSLFAGTNHMWSSFMYKYHYEYIDFYTFGFDEKYILSSGFLLRDEVDSNIIPNYFEPFLQKNIDIWVRYTIEGTLFFKADGDQDRPNQLQPSNH